MKEEKIFLIEENNNNGYYTFTNNHNKLSINNQSTNNTLPPNNHSLIDNQSTENNLPFKKRFSPLCKKRCKTGGIVVAYIFNGIYTAAVSLLFGAFAYKGAKDNHSSLGPLFFACSLIMNAPMAWFFSEQTVESGKRLIFTKKDFLFKVAVFFSVFLAVGTTGAAFQIVKDTVGGIKFINSNAPLYWFCVVFYAFNTFSTRLVGSTGLLFNLMNGVRNIICRLSSKYSPYYQFLDDIQRYGAQLNIKNIGREIKEVEHLKTYATRFYRAMQQQGLRPGNSKWHTVKNAVTLVASAAILWLIISFTPLWIYLTVRGVSKLPEYLSGKAAFVLYAALSNQLFYLNSGQKFVSTALNFYNRVYNNTKKKHPESSCRKAMTAVGTVLALLTIGGVAFLSGEGYNGEGKKASVNWPSGFGPLAEKLWFAHFSWSTVLFKNFYGTIAGVVAGVIVNGGAALSFSVSRLFPLLFKEKTQTLHSQAQTLLTQKINKGEFNTELRDTIEEKRDAANPHWSLWNLCSGNKKQNQLINDDDDSVQLDNSSSFLIPNAN